MARKKCTYGICNWPGLKFWTKYPPTIGLRNFRLAMNGMKIQKAGESVQKQNNTMHKVNEKAK